MPVVLLCHCDGTNGSTTFTDDSGLGRVLTAVSATVSTTSPKFGTGSADFTAANTARIAAGYSPDYNFGAGQFTIEAWAYFTSSPGLQAVLSLWDSGSNNSWWLGMNSGSLQFFYSTNGSSAVSIAASYTPTLNTWIHLAADRDASNVLRVYANGVVIASATAAATFFASTLNCLIGNDSFGSRGFPGRLDEARITKGIAQYGGAFTPATSSFSNSPTPVSGTYTSWSPTDKSTAVGLADLNLTAALTTNLGVRAVNSQSIGKYYFEITATTWAGSFAGMGIANASAILTGASNVGSTAANAAYLGSGGATLVNTVSTGVTFGSIANGSIIGIAVDLINTLIWFRVGAAGNWNANAGFAPGGTGGINFSAIGGGSTPVFPFVATSASGAAVFTANFGGSAFTGAVPAGFTSGWTIAASVSATRQYAVTVNSS